MVTIIVLFIHNTLLMTSLIIKSCVFHLVQIIVFIQDSTNEWCIFYTGAAITLLFPFSSTEEISSTLCLEMRAIKPSIILFLKGFISQTHNIVEKFFSFPYTAVHHGHHPTVSWDAPLMTLLVTLSPFFWPRPLAFSLSALIPRKASLDILFWRKRNLCVCVCLCLRET